MDAGDDDLFSNESSLIHISLLVSNVSGLGAVAPAG